MKYGFMLAILFFAAAANVILFAALMTGTQSFLMTLAMCLVVGGVDVFACFAAWDIWRS